jgi:cell division protein FtsB
MRAAVKKRKKKSIFLRVALAAFSVYVIIMLIQLQLEINNRQKKIAELNTLAEQLSRENEELEHKNENYEDYLEEKARENMARQGETIYIGN